MKKILLIFTVFVLTISVKAQYPITQNLGSPSTLVRVPTPGGFQASLINRNFADTIAANLTPISFYPGAMIFTTGDSSIWLRGTGATKWIKQFGNTSGAGGDTLIWKMSGNTVGLRQATPVLGTLDNYDLNIMTSGTTTMVVPQGGIIRSSASPNKYLLIDTITRRLHYGDGGSSSTPTWQQVLTAGSTLTTDNTVIGGNTKLSFTGMNRFQIEANGGSANSLFINTTKTVTSAPDGLTAFSLYNASPPTLEGLTNISTQSRLVGQETGNYQVGYVTLGSGLSLSSGVLSNSGVTSTPTWQQTLTAGSTLTTDNTIAGGGFDFTWNNLGKWAMGVTNTASGTQSVAIGESNTASNYLSFGIGYNNTASGSAVSVAIGSSNTSSAQYSVAIGNSNISNALSSLALGSSTTASAVAATSMGASTIASGQYSLAAGQSDTASGRWSTALGGETKASGDYSLSQGLESKATGVVSIAMGNGVVSSGYNATTFGRTYTNSKDTSFAFGVAGSTGLGARIFELTRDSAIISPTVATLISSSLKYSAGSPGDGKVLTSDATGNATWSTAPSALTLPISSLTASTGTNSITVGHPQTWNYNGIQSTTGHTFTSNSITSGTIMDITGISSFLAAGNEGLNIGISGANATNGITATGARISVTNTNATSGTNVGLDLTASGATTANNALNIAAGAIALNGSAGTSGQVLTSGGANALPTWTTPSSGGTPGGSDTYIQFNDGGSFGGDAGFTYNKTTNVFSTNNGAYRPTGTISFSDAGAGSVYRSSSDGLVFRAVTGSGYDLLMYDAVGNGVFGIEAGTSKLGSTSQIGAGLLGYGSWNAWMNLRGGTTTNASLTIRDGVAPSSPAEGQIWRTTDKIYNVIQTGAATKEFTLNDIALTSGRIPYTTTNGRLTDVSTFVVNSGNVGIGTGSPSALLHVMSTTEQLRVGYDASNYFSTTVGSAGAVAIAATGSSSSFNFSNRLSQKQGADVASASTIALGYDGNTFEITGTTNIELITKTGWQNGSIINLVFSDGLTVTTGVASSGNDITIILAGASHFETTADDVLTLMLCEVGGTQKWVEVSRSVN